MFHTCMCVYLYIHNIYTVHTHIYYVNKNFSFYFAINRLTALINIYIYLYIYIQSWPKILVNMIKEGCENHTNLTFHLIIRIENGGKYHYEIMFSQMHVGHNYWHPSKILWVKYLWSLFPLIFTILSTPWWLWTWKYPATASCFTEI